MAMDENAVRQLYKELLDAWNGRDAARYAKLFSNDGFVIGFDGSSHDGPQMIDSELGQIFAHHPTASYVAKVRDVHFLSDDVAVLRAVAGMVRPGESDLYPPVNSIQTMVAVKRDEKWCISAFQNTPAAYHGRPELAERLTEELRGELKEKDAKA